MRAQRRIWTWYLLTVLAVGLSVAIVDGVLASAPYLALHAVGLGVVWVLPVVGDRARLAWVVFAALGLPAAFSAVGLALPGLNPTPCEWACLAFDRGLFGTDPTVVLAQALGRWQVEVLQLCYASFYLLPVALGVALARARRWRAFDDALNVITFGFLLSYLGYLIGPTLPPYRFLDHGGSLEGFGLAEQLHALLHALEANRFDCLPSGHTMLTLVTLALAWRYARRLFLVLLPIGAGLIVATMALRYHYVIDVISGALLAPLSVVLARRATADQGTQ